MPSLDAERVVPHIATIHDLNLPRPQVGKSGELRDLYKFKGWRARFASRCVVAQGGRIALQKLDTEGVIKIPGGGMHFGEDVEAAARRELAEEIGVSGCGLRTLGNIVEYRRQWGMMQVSHCFETELDAGVTIGEATEDGSSLVWADSVRDAQDLIRGMEQDTYDKQFMAARDLKLLAFYESI